MWASVPEPPCTASTPRLVQHHELSVFKQRDVADELGVLRRRFGARFTAGASTSSLMGGMRTTLPVFNGQRLRRACRRRAPRPCGRVLLRCDRPIAGQRRRNQRSSRIPFSSSLHSNGLHAGRGGGAGRFARAFRSGAFALAGARFGGASASRRGFAKRSTASGDYSSDACAAGAWGIRIAANVLGRVRRFFGALSALLGRTAFRRRAFEPALPPARLCRSARLSGHVRLRTMVSAPQRGEWKERPMRPVGRRGSASPRSTATSRRAKRPRGRETAQHAGGQEKPRILAPPFARLEREPADKRAMANEPATFTTRVSPGKVNAAPARAAEIDPWRAAPPSPAPERQGERPSFLLYSPRRRPSPIAFRPGGHIPSGCRENFRAPNPMRQRLH